jgi:hypothetical protein
MIKGYYKVLIEGFLRLKELVVYVNIQWEKRPNTSPWSLIILQLLRVGVVDDPFH